MGIFGSLLGGVLGGGLGMLQGKAQQKNAAQDIQGQKDWIQQGWNQAAQYNRPNQTNAFGASSQWTKGPNGEWTQTQTLGPAEQARLDDFRQIAANRMGASKGIDLSGISNAIDWGSLGLGKLASAFKAPGISAATGARPYGDQAYSSAANMNSYGYNAPQQFQGMQTAPGAGQAPPPSSWQNFPVAPQQAQAPAAMPSAPAQGSLGGLLGGGGQSPASPAQLEQIMAMLKGMQGSGGGAMAGQPEQSSPWGSGFDLGGG